MMEYEKKVLLTSEEYQCLMRYTHFKYTTAVQTNYYYDTAELMFNTRGITCRIRKKEDGCIMTMKSHQSALLDCSFEYSAPVNTIAPILTWGDRKLMLWGSLTTIRSTFRLANHITVAIDKNIYLDTVDFELEIEYSQDQELAASNCLVEISNILFNHNLLFEPTGLIQRLHQSKSKSSRFFLRKTNFQNTL